MSEDLEILPVKKIEEKDGGKGSVKLTCCPVDAGRVGELETSQKVATSNLSEAQSSMESFNAQVDSRLANPDLVDEAIDAETGLTSAETDALGSAAELSQTASTGLTAGASAIEEGGIAATALGTDEAIGAGLDATGILAPLGVAVGVVGFLGSIIGSAVEAFEGHHETDSAPVNLGSLTSIAFDPSST